MRICAHGRVNTHVCACVDGCCRARRSCSGLLVRDSRPPCLQTGSPGASGWAGNAAMFKLLPTSCMHVCKELLSLPKRLCPAAVQYCRLTPCLLLRSACPLLPRSACPVIDYLLLCAAKHRPKRYTTSILPLARVYGTTHATSTLGRQQAHAQAQAHMHVHAQWGQGSRGSSALVGGSAQHYSNAGRGGQACLVEKAQAAD